jgi:hypothetical protein
LAWGVLGLSAWDARPAEADVWLEESAERLLAGDSRPAEESLLLMALTKNRTFDSLFAAVEDLAAHA